MNPRARPRVSIGMPVFNGATYIRDALDSLLAQTYADFEIIIADNASTDATEATCREYTMRDSRIRYVRHRENRGIVANFQHVLDEAVGDYFMWAAADDTWDPQWIETLLPIASEHQCLAYGLVQTADAHGLQVAHPANTRRFEFRGNRTLRRLRYYWQLAPLGKGNPIYGIAPTSLLRHIGIQWVESEEQGGDMLWLYVLLDQTEIRHGGRVFLYKRLHGDCTGATVGPGPIQHKPSRAVRLVSFLRIVTAAPMVTRYIKHSSTMEAVVLAALYPASITLTAGVLLSDALKRRLPRLPRANNQP